MNKLIQAMYESTDEDKRDVVYQMMKWIIDGLRSGDTNQLNEFYRQLDVSKLSLLFLASPIRGAFSYRAHLPAFDDFRLRAIEEAKARYPDTWKGAFVGLIDIKSDKPSPWAGDFDRLVGIHPSISRP